MSVHFGYNYKAALIKKLQERYASQIENIANDKAKQRLLDEAEKTILDFFYASRGELALLEEASSGSVEYRENDEDYIARLKIENCYIQFSRKPQAIEIERGDIDSDNGMTRMTIYGHIVPEEKRCVLKKVGKVHDGSTFDENVLNSYIRKTFSDVLNWE